MSREVPIYTVDQERFRLDAVLNDSLCVLGVLGQPFPALLLGHNDVHDRFSSVLEWLEINLNVGWEEHFGVPGEALACSDVRDQSRRAFWVPNVDGVGFGL